MTMSTSGFFHGATLQSFLLWAMPLAQQTSKDTLSASPGQVKAHAEARAEEDGQVPGRGWPCPLGTLPPAAVETGQLAGRFVSKAGRIFSRDHLVTYGRADRRQDVTPGHSPKLTWDLQGDGSQDPCGCQNRPQEVLGGLQRGHMMVREVSERTSAFILPKASFSTPPASIPYPVYVSLASIRGFQYYSTHKKACGDA